MNQTILKNSRFLIGITLCIFAIAGTVAVIAISRESSVVLVAAKVIQPGEEITANNLTEVSANLGELGKQFLVAADIGSGTLYATDFIEKGEVIPLTRTSTEFDDALVTVAIKPTVQPSVGIEVGSVVDVWVIPEADSFNLSLEDLPRIIAGGAKVIDVERIEGFGISTSYQYEVAVKRAELSGILAVVGAGEEIAVVEGALQNVAD